MKFRPDKKRSPEISPIDKCNVLALLHESGVGTINMDLGTHPNLKWQKTKQFKPNDVASEGVNVFQPKMLMLQSLRMHQGTDGQSIEMHGRLKT